MPPIDPKDLRREKASDKPAPAKSPAPKVTTPEPAIAAPAVDDTSPAAADASPDVPADASPVGTCPVHGGACHPRAWCRRGVRGPR